MRKVRGFAKKRYNAKITENPKNYVFGKIMLNLKFSQNLRKSSVKEGDIDMSQKTKITKKT